MQDCKRHDARDKQTKFILNIMPLAIFLSCPFLWVPQLYEQLYTS